MKYKYDAEVVHVVDGDTMDVELDLGFKISNTVRLRLSDVDTREIFGVEKESEEYKQGIKQKKFVENYLEEAESLVVETLKDDKGKYGRYLARIHRDGEDKTLVDHLVEEFDDLEKLE